MFPYSPIFCRNTLEQVYEDIRMEIFFKQLNIYRSMNETLLALAG